jgi:hypothetical protein
VWKNVQEEVMAKISWKNSLIAVHICWVIHWLRADRCLLRLNSELLCLLIVALYASSVGWPTGLWIRIQIRMDTH